MTTRTLRRDGTGKFFALLWVSLRHALSERAALLARMAFLTIILLVFSRLWIVVIADGGLEGRSAIDFLWYLLITEWIMLSLPLVLPPTVTGYYLIVLLGRRGWLGDPLYGLTGWSIPFTWVACVIAASVMAFASESTSP